MRSVKNLKDKPPHAYDPVCPCWRCQGMDVRTGMVELDSEGWLNAEIVGVLGSLVALIGLCGWLAFEVGKALL